MVSMGSVALARTSDAGPLSMWDLDGLRKFGERGGEAVLGIDLDTEFVVTAAEVLDKGHVRC